MSRSGLVDMDDCEPLDYGRWRGQVASSIRGKRGQRALKDILAALDAMPVKELCKNNLVSADGQYCTLGVLGNYRGLNVEIVDPQDRELVSTLFDISEQLAAEIMWYNDEYIDDRKCEEIEICGPLLPYYPENRRITHYWSPNENAAKDRWKHMRAWVASKIINLSPVEQEASASDE